MLEFSKGSEMGDVFKGKSSHGAAILVVIWCTFILKGWHLYTSNESVLFTMGRATRTLVALLDQCAVARVALLGRGVALV